jgi:hypothetical protein
MCWISGRCQVDQSAEDWVGRQWLVPPLLNLNYFNISIKRVHNGGVINVSIAGCLPDWCKILATAQQHSFKTAGSFCSNTLGIALKAGCI